MSECIKCGNPLYDCVCISVSSASKPVTPEMAALRANELKETVREYHKTKARTPFTETDLVEFRKYTEGNVLLTAVGMMRLLATIDDLRSELAWQQAETKLAEGLKNAAVDLFDAVFSRSDAPLIQTLSEFAVALTAFRNRIRPSSPVPPRGSKI